MYSLIFAASVDEYKLPITNNLIISYIVDDESIWSGVGMSVMPATKAKLVMTCPDATTGT